MTTAQKMAFAAIIAAIAFFLVTTKLTSSGGTSKPPATTTDCFMQSDGYTYCLGPDGLYHAQ